MKHLFLLQMSDSLDCDTGQVVTGLVASYPVLCNPLSWENAQVWDGATGTTPLRVRCAGVGLCWAHNLPCRDLW